MNRRWLFTYGLFLSLLLSQPSLAGTPGAGGFPKAPPLPEPVGEVIHVSNVDQHHAVDCVARNNSISHCPETGILACYTKDCQISGDTFHDPSSPLPRLIRVQDAHDGLRVADNLLIGPPMQVTSDSRIVQQGNVVRKALAKTTTDDVGQSVLPLQTLAQATEQPVRPQQSKGDAAAALLEPGLQPEEVIEAMRQVHAGFEGREGYVAQFGDSITYSMAFWTPIGWDSPDRYLAQDDGLPKRPKNTRWRDWVKGTRDKGPKFANYSGWKIGQLNAAMGAVLDRDKPEVAIVMIGTNDISAGQVPPTYGDDLEQVIGKCLDAHCVPILNTIPPRRGREEAVAAANRIVRQVAKEMKVPLADFHAECIRLRPGASWDGTIISQDGVHPSGGKTNVYTEENMKNCGYALRNWVDFLVLRQLYFRVLGAEQERSP